MTKSVLAFAVGDQTDLTRASVPAHRPKLILLLGSGERLRRLAAALRGDFRQR